MSKNATILHELLIMNGYHPVDVWYHLIVPGIGNWWAEMENGDEYHLGREYSEAKQNIENKTIKLDNG